MRFSRERKELLKRNKKHFAGFIVLFFNVLLQVLLFKLEKQTSKNVADTTFN